MTGNRTELLHHVIEVATRAPSVHNTQPWSFIVSGDTLTLVADSTRQLKALDPTGRQMWISCGCALFNARVAIAAAGLNATVTRTDDGDRTGTVAHILLGEAGPLSADDQTLAALGPAVGPRGTNRRSFTDEAVPPELIAVLEDAARREGARAREITSEQDRVVVAMLAQRADRMQYEDPAYRAELREWTTDDRTRPDGVPAFAVPHVDAGSGDEIPVRDFDSRGAGELPTRTASTREQCLLLLGADADSPAGWVRTGEAMERVLLEIARHGFAASPLTQIVEVASTRAQLRSELELDMHPDVLIRIGHAAPTPRTNRRPVDDVVVHDES